MTSLPFNSNSHLRLGVEIEIQLIDPATGDLKPVGLQVLDSLRGAPFSERIKAELFQSMLEIDTPICETAHDVSASLDSSMALVREHAARFEANVMMSGTHPFADYSERLLTPHSRYYQLVDRNRWIARRLQIFGLHVHLGMRDGDHAIAMNNALCHYLPFVLALSASSPYWHGEDTGLASSRITFFEAIPTGGHPYLLASWREFEDLIERLTVSKSITSLKDLWWDIRPNTEFGTIEVRIADCPPTLQETESLVAFIHALAVFIDEELSKGLQFAPPPEWVLRENKWRASRHGVQCDLIRDARGTSIPFADLWQDLRTALNPVTARFGYEKYFLNLDEVLQRGPSYLRQRHAYDGQLLSVVQHLTEEGRTNRPQWPPNHSA